MEYDPKADAPRWKLFLKEIFAESEMISFVQRLLGYCLTGSTGEQVMPIFWGGGANGKSTIIETMLSLLGHDYTGKAPSDLIARKRNPEHSTVKTILRGRRLVAVNETDDRCRLSEATVKELSGSDTISARRMYEDHRQFHPTHKLILATNHKPEIVGRDNAIWRRIALVPFGIAIPPEKRDPGLLDKLRAELPGILTWCVKGCSVWQRILGLGVPPGVTTATASYRTEEDTLLAFIAECCETGPDMKVKASELLSVYRKWSGDAITPKSFGTMLTERGYGSRDPGGIRYRTGLRLRENGT